MDVQTVTVPISGTAASGILAAGTCVIGRVSSAAYGGAITVVEALAAAKLGTATVRLVDMGAAGTSVVGTIVALAYAAADITPLGSVLATAYKLDAGDYYGVEIAAGTILAPFYISMNYLPGV